MTLTTEEMLATLQAEAVTDIEMSEQGLEFRNEDGEVLFLLPFAKGGDA